MKQLSFFLRDRGEQDAIRHASSKIPWSNFAGVSRELAKKGVEFAERFWLNIEVREGANSCWMWSGDGRGKKAYGRVLLNGKSMHANQASYLTFVGPIPEGMIICHACDQPGCIRPSHLFLGTHSDNARDREQKGRRKVRRELRGEEKGAAKITWLDVICIRELYKKGDVQSDLAQHFGISEGTVSTIIRGVAWKHVRGPLPGL